MSKADSFIVITSTSMAEWTNTVITVDDGDDAIEADNGISNLTRIWRGWSEPGGAIVPGEVRNWVIRELANMLVFTDRSNERTTFIDT